MNKLAPVVLIHGMWSTPDVFKELRYFFENEGYEVFTPRLPFHYPLPQMNETARAGLKKSGIDDYVNAVSNVINSLDQKPIVIGYSLGGLLAQLIAARHECEKLILVSSAAPAGIHSWSWSVIRTLGHNLFKFPLWKSITNLNLKNIQYGVANSQPKEVQKELAAEITLESGRASWQIAMWFLYKNPITKVNTYNTNCPVLVIGGTEDKITPIKIQRKIADKYGHKATLSEVRDACHWTIGGTYFPQISQTMIDWLNKNNAVS
ncbi:MAG: alpha/beta hydrolase [Bermanella sp.]